MYLGSIRYKLEQTVPESDTKAILCLLCRLASDREAGRRSN